MIYLGIIEDEPIMLASVEECFEASRDVEVVLAATSVEDFLAGLPSGAHLTTMLLDIMLPGMTGIAGYTAPATALPRTGHHYAHEFGRFR